MKGAMGISTNLWMLCVLSTLIGTLSCRGDCPDGFHLDKQGYCLLDDSAADSSGIADDTADSGVAVSDADGDGFIALEAGGDDCDDQDPYVNPSATEIMCNDVDENCDGEVETGTTVATFNDGWDIHNVRLAYDPASGHMKALLGGHENLVWLEIDDRMEIVKTVDLAPVSDALVTYMDVIRLSDGSFVISYFDYENLDLYMSRPTDGLEMEWDQQVLSSGDLDAAADIQLCANEDDALPHLALIGYWPSGSEYTSSILYAYPYGGDYYSTTLSTTGIYLGLDLSCQSEEISALAYIYASDSQDLRTRTVDLSAGDFSDATIIDSSAGWHVFGASGQGGEPWAFYYDDDTNGYMQVGWWADDALDGPYSISEYSEEIGYHNGSVVSSNDRVHSAFIDDGALHYITQDGIDYYDPRFEDDDDTWEFADIEVDDEDRTWIAYGNDDTFNLAIYCE